MCFASFATALTQNVLFIFMSEMLSFHKTVVVNMAEKRMDLYFRCLIICATLTLVSSLTLPTMVTKPARHTNYTSNSTSGANGTKIGSKAVTVDTTGVVLYKVYASDGVNCIILKVDGLTEVYFKSYIGEETVYNYMIDDAIIEGICGYEDIASMRIVWDGYTMIWNFAKTPGGERWYVSQVELTVSAELERFHSIKSHVLPAKSFKLAHTHMLFPTPVGKSYSCPESTIDLVFPEGEYNPAGLSGKVFLRTFQIQPFIFKGIYFGPAFDCSLIVSRHKISQIVGGLVLSIGVLVTIAGYGVFRYFKTKSTAQ